MTTVRFPWGCTFTADLGSSLTAVSRIGLVASPICSAAQTPVAIRRTLCGSGQMQLTSPITLADALQSRPPIQLSGSTVSHLRSPLR